MRARLLAVLRAAPKRAGILWPIFVLGLSRQLVWDRIVDPINEWIDRSALPVAAVILRAVVEFVTLVPGLGVIVAVVVLILVLSYWETRPIHLVQHPGQRAQVPTEPERRFLDDAVTPAYLTRLFNAQGNASIKPFIGNWMRLGGTVETVTESQTSDEASVAFTDPDGVPIVAWFSPAWLGRVRTLVPGARVEVAGRLDFVLTYLAVGRCELLDAGPSPPQRSPNVTRREPLTLPQRCVRLADEIEAEVARRDHLLAGERRAEDASYQGFVQPLRQIEQELRVVAHMPVGHLATIEGVTDLNREHALEMVRALRGLIWGGESDAVPPARYYGHP